MIVCAGKKLYIYTNRNPERISVFGKEYYITETGINCHR